MNPADETRLAALEQLCRGLMTANADLVKRNVVLWRRMAEAQTNSARYEYIRDVWWERREPRQLSQCNRSKLDTEIDKYRGQLAPMNLDRKWGTVVCCASGPSFSAEQAELITAARATGSCRVFVVNDNWRRVPTADVLYAADRQWWRVHIGAVRAGFAGEVWTQDEKAALEFGLNHVKMVRGNALLPHGDQRISCGSNGGFQTMMLARLFGARRIILVGFDMQHTGGLMHWFGAHAHGLANGDPKTFIKHFEAVAPAFCAEGTEVVNCSLATALTCFPRADLAATLEAHALA